MSRPSVFAVLRLMTSSNFVGCSTGRSAGLAPVRILSTKNAAYCFRLERLPGGACTHWKAPPLHGARQKRTWWACRTLSVKTLNVNARQGGIASRGGRDADRLDC